MSYEDDLTVPASADMIRELLANSPVDAVGDLTEITDATVDGSIDLTDEATAGASGTTLDGALDVTDVTEVADMTNEATVGVTSDDFADLADLGDLSEMTTSDDPTVNASAEDTIEPPPDLLRSPLVWEPAPSDDEVNAVESNHVSEQVAAQHAVITGPAPVSNDPPGPPATHAPDAHRPAASATAPRPLAGDVPAAVPPPPVSAVPSSPPGAEIASPASAVHAEPSAAISGQSAAGPDPAATEAFFELEPFVPERNISRILVIVAGLPLLLLLAAVVWYLFIR